MTFTAPHRILWIDDDGNAGESEAPLLELLGYRVSKARTGHQGLLLATEITPDAVILDLRLPDIHGLKVLEEIRANYAIPVLILTGYTEFESVLAASKLGASLCLEKPVDVEELSQALRKLVSGARQPSADLGALINELSIDELSIEQFLQRVRRFRRFHRRNTDSGNRFELSQRTRCVHPVVRAVVTLMQVETRWWTEEEIAREVGLTRSHLSRVIKVSTGLTFRQLRRAILMRSAVKSLLTTTEQVSQIAYSVGFRHPPDFNRVFSATFGCTPTELRRLQRLS